MKPLEPRESASSSSLPIPLPVIPIYGPFTGLSVTDLRQCLYLSTRMGMYKILKHQWHDPSVGTSHGENAGRCIPSRGCEMELQNVVDALMTIVKQESFMSLSAMLLHVSCVGGYSSST